VLEHVERRISSNRMVTDGTKGFDIGGRTNIFERLDPFWCHGCRFRYLTNFEEHSLETFTFFDD
jgi:hypothetical protein